MKSSKFLTNGIVVILTLIPFIYLGTIYPSLPDIIPIHFNIEGKADGYGGKTTLIFITTLLSLVGAGCYLLIKNLPKIDPKKTAGQSPERFTKMAITLVVFMCALNIIITYSAINQSVNISKNMLPLIGLLFAFLGNYMQNIKANYFVGVRTPWTLENDDNWRETHLLASKMWLIGGILITLVTLVTPAKFGFIFFMSITAIISLVPVIFSYRYFKKHQQ